MNLNKCFVYTQEEIVSVAQVLHKLFKQCQVFTFTGSLGAGKTTLVSALLRQAGVTDPITSPTFAYMNVYHNEQEQTFYHFDCYRLKSCDEFIAAGFDEYLYQPNSWCFIEWPEFIMPLLTKQVCKSSIEYDGFDKRKLCYQIIR